MGLAMANNLQRHLAAKKAPSLLYTNRTMSRGEPLKALGGIPEPSFEQLVSRSSIIFTMVRTKGIGITRIKLKPLTRLPMTLCCKACFPRLLARARL